MIIYVYSHTYNYIQLCFNIYIVLLKNASHQSADSPSPPRTEAVAVAAANHRLPTVRTLCGCDYRREILPQIC